MPTNYLKILFSLLLTLTAWGCQKESEPQVDEVHTSSVDVYFRLSVEGEDSQYTRGTWNDNLDTDPNNNYTEEIGTRFDNRIRTESVQVLIYQKGEGPSADTYIGKVKDLMCYPINESGNEYQFIGTIDKGSLIAGASYKFMVLANSDTSVSESDMANLIFNVQDIQYNQSKYLPMWGVVSLDKLSSVQPRYDLGDIYLLRAAAKVRVELSDAMAKKFALIQASITNYNTQGYVLPGSWNQVAQTTQLSHQSETPNASFRPFTSASTTPTSFVEEVPSKQFVAYLPEYKNSVDKEAVIEVKVKELSTDKIYTFANHIKFRAYSAGVPSTDASTIYDLVRNYIYQFTIANIQPDNTLELKCVVNPWQVHEESWDYSEQISVSKQMTWTKGSYQYLDNDGNVVMTPGKKLECTFQIDTPKGANWHASFIPLKGKADAFLFYTDEHPEGLSELTGEMNQLATLKIFPKYVDIQENNHALLKIIVRTPDGRTLQVQSALLPDNFGSKADEGFTIIQSK